MDVVLALGARPGYMKMWPVYQAFINRGIVPTVIATGQHHEILTQQQAILPMPINHWLLKEQPHYALGKLFEEIHQEARYFLFEHNPDVVFVNGDTTSALAVAMAAFHLEIPIAHVESGLRSGNIKSPYPEEFNRIAVDAMSSYLFAPTERAAKVCRDVNPHGKVTVTGNTVIDALKEGLRQISVKRPSYYSYGPYLLLDLHRRETDETSMEKIVKVVIKQAVANGIHVIWPAHPNPKIQSIAKKYRGLSLRIHTPMDYLTYIQAMRDANLILTDSGGVTEEAISLCRPTIQLRDCTDRQEAIDVNASWLGTTNPAEIERLLKIAIPYAQTWHEFIKTISNPYGDGTAGIKVVDYFFKSSEVGGSAGFGGGMFRNEP